MGRAGCLQYIGTFIELAEALGEALLQLLDPCGKAFVDAGLHELPTKQAAAKKTTKKQLARKAAAKKTTGRRPRSA
ncbi:hypothetical protein [Streptomyces sp. NPDC002078]